MNPLAKYGYYLASIFTMLKGIRRPLQVIKLFLGKPDDKQRNIHLRKPPLTMRIRSRMDCWSVKEAMLDQFYTRKGFDIVDDWVIMDIGAAIGEFALDAALKAKQGRVIAYEPFPGSFELLQINIQQNNINNVVVSPLAIWADCDEIEITTGMGEPLQVGTVGFENNAHSHLIVETIDLETALAQNQLLHLDLLKLDCEGAEYPILLGLSAQILSKIDRIVLEYHDGVGGHDHHELTRFLGENDFVVKITPNVVHSHLGYLYAHKPGIE